MTSKQSEKSRLASQEHSGLFKHHQIKHINEARKVAGLDPLKIEDLRKPRKKRVIYREDEY